VTNSNGIFADQNVFNQESYDFLAFNHTKGFGGTAQASKECCEVSAQAQECRRSLVWSEIACSSSRSVCWP